MLTKKEREWEKDNFQHIADSIVRWLRDVLHYHKPHLWYFQVLADGSYREGQQLIGAPPKPLQVFTLQPKGRVILKVPEKGPRNLQELKERRERVHRVASIAMIATVGVTKTNKMLKELREEHDLKRVPSSESWAMRDSQTPETVLALKGKKAKG